MKKRILILGMVLLIGIVTAVPAFAGTPSDYDLDEGPDCLGKMVSGQAQDHEGWKNVAEGHGKDTVKEGMDGSKNYCANL